MLRHRLRNLAVAVFIGSLLLVTGCTGQDQPKPVQPTPTVPKAPADIVGTMQVYFGIFATNARGRGVPLTIPADPNHDFREAPGSTSCTNTSGDTFKIGDKAGGQTPIISVCIVNSRGVIYYAPQRYLKIPQSQIMDTLLQIYLDWLKADFQYHHAKPHQLTDTERRCYTAQIQVGLRDAGYLTTAEFNHIYAQATNKNTQPKALRIAYQDGAGGKVNCLDF